MDPEPSDSDDLSDRSSNKPKLADTFADDDDIPGVSNDPTQAGHPDEDPELGPTFKERRKPRSKIGEHSSTDPEKSPENVTIHQIASFQIAVTFDFVFN